MDITALTYAWEIADEWTKIDNGYNASTWASEQWIIQCRLQHEYSDHMWGIERLYALKKLPCLKALYPCKKVLFYCSCHGVCDSIPQCDRWVYCMLYSFIDGETIVMHPDEKQAWTFFSQTWNDVSAYMRLLAQQPLRVDDRQHLQANIYAEGQEYHQAFCARYPQWAIPLQNMRKPYLGPLVLDHGDALMKNTIRTEQGAILIDWTNISVRPYGVVLAHILSYTLRRLPADKWLQTFRMIHDAHPEADLSPNDMWLLMAWYIQREWALSNQSVPLSLLTFLQERIMEAQ